VKVSWGAIFAGTVTALGLWVLLYSLGLALGLSSINPQDTGSARSSGIFTGIWGLIAPLVALFVGGIVAGRGSGAQTKASGGIHGLVMWGLTTLAGLWLVANLVSALAGGLFSVGKSAVQATGSAVSAGASQAGGVGEAARSFGLDADDALRPVNERLRSEGKPAVTAVQLEAATRDVVQTAVQQGRLDREVLVSSIAEKTALSRRDAQEVAGRVEAQFSALQGKAGQAAQSVQTGALKAADATGKAFWGVFGSLFLGLISALLGSTLGVSKRQRLYAEGAVVTPPEGGLPPTRREVYP
jgi:spore maturation protein SpmA